MLNAKYMVVAPPRGGFTLLISVLNELCMLKGHRKGNVSQTVNHFVPLASRFVSNTIESFFKEYINPDDFFYSGEFKALTGGPKWLDTSDNSVCVRKYFGAKDSGDFTFIQHHPMFVLDCDNVVHSHVHPRLWTEHPDFTEHMKLASIRNPIDIIHSSIYSINALTSEYIQRCVEEDETSIRYKLAMKKFTDLHFMDGLILYLVKYLKEFIPVRDRFLYVMRWEDLILKPINTILEIASAAKIDINSEIADAIWKKIQYRNLPMWHRHNFRKGQIGDWVGSITNSHLELFEKHGFNDFLEEFGYEKITYFNKRNYTETQKTIEEYISRGAVYEGHEDKNLSIFAFNKTNFSPTKNAHYSFKTYPRTGDFQIERSCFKDEKIVKEFMKLMTETIAVANNFISDIRKAATECDHDEIMPFRKIESRYFRELAKVYTGNDIRTYHNYFNEFLKNRVPKSNKTAASAKSYKATAPPLLSLSLHFYEPTGDQLELSINNLIRKGYKRFLLAPDNETSNGVANRFKDSNAAHFAVRDRITEPLLEERDGQVVIITESLNADVVSTLLLECLNMKTGIIIAPVTEHHISKRPVFISSIPKAGTHMLIGMLEKMGVKQNYSPLPAPRRWNTIHGYDYHAPCKDFIASNFSQSRFPISKYPLFYSPMLFIYRNPLDILTSELSWFQRPSEVYSHYLNCFDDRDSKLLALIDDPFVLGSVRERMNRYIGWLGFSNVIPISFEEIVGSRGGGDNIEQAKTIWSLQLKLHIPGCPKEFAGKIYDENSPTFYKGKVGLHKEVFKKEHYDKFLALPQDFMEKMGYTSDTILPKHVDAFRRRPLNIWQPSSEEVWSQRLVASLSGYNIIYAGGEYIVVSQKLGSLDLSNESVRGKDDVYPKLGSYEEAVTLAVIKERGEEKREESERVAVSISKLIEMGERQFEDGNHKMALEIFTRVAELSPENYENWNNLGVVFLSLSRLDDAKKCLRKSVSLNSNFTEAVENLKRVEEYSKVIVNDDNALRQNLGEG